jgi:hypothetical protein
MHRNVLLRWSARRAGGTAPILNKVSVVGALKRTAFLALGLICFSSTLNAAPQSKPTSLLTIVPSPNVKAIDPNGLYLVNVTCRVSAAPEQNVNLVFEKKIREAALTLTLSNARVGANSAPAATSILAAIPVFAVTISPDPPTFFKNSGCNQSLVITGRTPLYLTGVWTDQQSSAPSQLTVAISAIASLVGPLAPLFPTGPANLIKGDTAIANSMASPFSQLIAATNWSETETETTAELRETTYTVRANYFTKQFFAAGYVSPAATVSISVKRIPSMQDALKVQAINAAYQASIQALAGTVQKDPTTCIAIGRTLEFVQNYTHQDAVAALSQAVFLSGIGSDKVQTCLGTAYGPEVIQTSYWKSHSKMPLTTDSFHDIEVVIPFQPLVFSQISAAMNDYAAGKHNNVIVDGYFAPQVAVTDVNSVLGLAANSSMEQILDALKAAKGQYLYYGCAQTDNAFDGAIGNPDVGYVLAIDKSLKPENMLIMRMWWKLDRPGNSQPRIYKIALDFEGNLVKQALSADNNQCGLGVKIPSQ